MCVYVCINIYIIIIYLFFLSESEIADSIELNKSPKLSFDAYCRIKMVPFWIKESANFIIGGTVLLSVFFFFYFF